MNFAAEWVSAVGTGGALLIALALFGYQTWDRFRDHAERRRSQAELISAAIGPMERPHGEGDLGRTGIDLFNSSPSPVYRVVVGIVFIQGAGPTTIEEMLALRGEQMAPVTTLSILPPGNFRAWIPGVSWSSIMSGRSGAEIAFTDRAGKHWIRRAAMGKGTLEALGQDPIEYFSRKGLHGPYDLLTPERMPPPGF